MAATLNILVRNRHYHCFWTRATLLSCTRQYLFSTVLFIDINNLKLKNIMITIACSLIHRSFDFSACYINRSFYGSLIHSLLPYRDIHRSFHLSLVPWSIDPSIAPWPFPYSLIHRNLNFSACKIAHSVALWSIAPWYHPMLLPWSIACII